MAAPSKPVYKTISLADSKNRTLTPLTDPQKTQVKTIVTNFIKYMVNKHS